MVVMSWMAVFMAVFYAVSPLIQAIITKNCVVLLQNIKSVLSYIFYTPTYQIALMTYAFARIDDLSWATKGRNEADP
jgi:cellulose synthase/poly-beta-1,6-N-acetylglucosamine synthase-like glycosyltransferase